MDRVAIHVDISGDNLAANERQFGAMKGQQSIEGTDHYGSPVNLHIVSTFEVTKISAETVKVAAKKRRVSQESTENGPHFRFPSGEDD